MNLCVNLVVLWLALSAVQRAAGSPSKIAITHVSVIDVRAGTIEKDMTVLIVGDRISAIRAAKEKEKLPTKEIEVIEKRQACFCWKAIACRTYAIPGVSSL